MTLWAGRVGAELAPEVWDVPARRTTRSCSRTTRRATLLHAERLHAAGLLDDGELRRGRASARGASTVEELAATRTSTRRSSGCSARSAARSTRAARATTRSRPRSGSTSPTRAPRPTRRSRAFARRRARPRRGGGRRRRCPATRTSSARIPVTVGHHLLAWVEMLERDRARFRFARAQAQPSPLGAGALAGSTLPLPPPPDADAQLARRRRRPRLRARLPLRRAVLFTHLSRIGEELVLWTTSEFGFARLPEDGGDRARR